MPKLCPNVERTNPRRRLASCLLLAAASLASAGCGEKSVATVSTEGEAIEIINVLRENGFEVEKEQVVAEGGGGGAAKWSVVIDEGMFGGGGAGAAAQVMHDYGLPRPDDVPVDGGGGFVPSETAQRLQEQRRIRADVERQLRALPGVLSAIVTVVLPPPDQAYRLQQQPATASALVIYKDERPLFTTEQVQNMVSKSVPELKLENVSVTMSRQTPRPVPHRELGARRRNNIILAAGVGLVIVLGFLLAVLLLQSRRQRAELAELRDTQGGEEELGPADDSAAAQLGGPGAPAPAQALPPAREG